MNEQASMFWQIVVSAAVPLLVAVVGIIATCVAARSTADSEVKKSIVLRFVKMFERAAEGLSSVSDVYANVQTLFSTPMSKESLPLRLQAMLAFGQEYRDVAKVADSAILRLNIYFPSPGNEAFEMYPSTSSILRLVAYIAELDQKMKREGRIMATDEEYAQYQALEKIAAENIKPLQAYYNARRKYFNDCYAGWRKKNLPFLKWNKPKCHGS